MTSFLNENPFSKGSLWAALAGAGGGLLSYFVGEVVAAQLDMWQESQDLTNH